MKRIALIVCMAACGGMFASAGTDAWFARDGKPTIEQRATFDLACPASSLRYQQLGKDWRTVGVVGCDKRASYVYDEEHALWVQNSDTQARASN